MACFRNGTDIYTAKMFKSDPKICCD